MDAERARKGSGNERKRGRKEGRKRVATLCASLSAAALSLPPLSPTRALAERSRRICIRVYSSAA